MLKSLEKMSGSKKLSAVIATLTVVALLITGTFAWSATFNKVNEFTGSKTNVTLHDDFKPEIGQKDVYVENTGSAPALIRLKLDEFMDLTTKVATANPDWQTHVFSATLPNQRELPDCGNENHAGELFHDYFTWELGGKKWYMPSNGSSQIVQDTTVYTGTETGVKETPIGQFYPMSEYVKLSDPNKDSYVGWLYDTDGYVYWSKPLNKNEATGLLLHKVIGDTDKLKNFDYYYAINVIVEAIDKSDIPMWSIAGTTAGKGSVSVDPNNTNLYNLATANGRRFINYMESKMVS